jgi:hypothetical protein
LTTTKASRYETYGSLFVAPAGDGATFKLYDFSVAGSLNAMSMKNNYIQYMQGSTLKLDAARAYYWNPTKKYWCYKNSVDGVQNKDTEVTNASELTIKPGEGFLMTAANAVTLKIMVPDSIKNL